MEWYSCCNLDEADQSQKREGKIEERDIWVAGKNRENIHKWKLKQSESAKWISNLSYSSFS